MRKRYTFLFVITAFVASPFAQSTGSVTGRWQSAAEDTREVKSIIEIYEQDGKFDGRIAEILTDNKDDKCTKYSGKLKIQPMLGPVIIKDLETDGDEWNGGTIFAPQKGPDYRLVAWSDDSPDKLFIRGKHWTSLNRTQT